MVDTATPRQSSLSLLPGIVDRPNATLAQVVAYPRARWVLPAVVSLAALLLYVAVAAPYLAEQMMQQVQSRMGSLQPGQQEQVQEQISRLTTPGAVTLLTLISGGLSLALAWLIGSLILFFGLLLAGEEIGFSSVVAGFSWTWLPLALRNLVDAGWVFFTQEVIVNPGLSYFVSTGDPVADAQNYLWNLARYMDLFSLWHVLLVFLLARVFNRKSAGLLTAVYVVISLGLRVVAATALGALGPAG